jgi:outer membrane protein
MPTARLATLAALSLFAAGSAQSQPAGAPGRDFEIRIGAGAFVASAYPGSDRIRVLPLPSVNASYQQTAFVSFPEILRLDAVRAFNGQRGALSAGPVVRFGFGREESRNRSALRGLGDVDDTVELGGFAGYDLGGGFSVRATAVQAAGGHEGFLANLAVSYAQRLPGGLFAAVSPSITYADARYHEAFYGIDGLQSGRSGRAPYRPGDGIERAGITAFVSVPITDRLSLLTFAGYARLLGDAADSPIVRGPGGSADQFGGGIFLSYQLY